MHVLASNGERRTELDLNLGAKGLADPSEQPAEIRFELTPAEGSLEGRGELRIAPLEIRADLDWKDLDVPALIATIPRAEVAGLRSARSGGRLEIRSTAASGLGAQGDVSVAAFSFEGASPSVPRLDWKNLDVKIAALDLPGVLAGAPTPPAVDLASVALNGASIVVERGAPAAAETAPTDHPVAPAEPPPPGSGGRRDAASSATAAVASLDAAATEVASGGAAPEDTAVARSAVALAIAELTVSDSRVEVLDRTFGDPVRAEMAKIELRATGLDWSVRRIGQLDLTMEGPAGARVKLKGAAKRPSSAFELDVQGLELVPFDAYGRQYGGVTVEAGTASLESSLALSGERYETDSKLVLHDLDLSGEGEQGFAKRFGVPLGLALALLRDVQGDITLDIPVSGGREGIGVGFGKAMTSALERILVNALASPLKLIGSVVVAGRAIRGFDVEPIRFEAGRADLVPEAQERIAKLGSVLAGRPELAVRLEGRIAASDIAALRDAELRSALADPKSAAAKAVAALDDAAAKSVRDYLDSPRGDGAVAAKPPPVVEQLRAKIDVSKGRLVSLGRDRAERARAAIAAVSGVAPEQLEARAGTGEVRAKEPQVIVEMASR